MDYQACLPTPFSVLGICCSADKITGIKFLPLTSGERRPQTEFSRQVCESIQQYLQHPAQLNPLPVALEGTPFQKKVWQAISHIAPGQTLTYATLARQVGSGARATANACGANPVPLFVPCHRVVASNGLGGFMQGNNFYSLEIKRWLLRHERNVSGTA